MEVGLGGGEVDGGGGRDDADTDWSAAGLRNERVEDLVVVHEEVQVQPERVRQQHFRELGRTAPGQQGLGLLGDDRRAHQPRQVLEVLDVRVFAFGGMSGQFLVEHLGHQLQLAVAHHHHVDLLRDDLVLHSYIIIMEISSPNKL